MNLQRLSIFGTDNIGVYIFSNDKYTIVPKNLDSETKKIIRDNLETEIIETTIADSYLIGVFVAGNNNVILLPKNVRDDEIKTIKEIAKDVKVKVLNLNTTALGNVILCNDNSALIYPEFSDYEMKEIKEALEIDNIKKGRIAHVSVVGSVGVITNKGGIVHIDATDDEINELSKFFKVKIDIGTVNFGSAFIRSGLIANYKGALVGSSTTGPEILRIQKALGD
ncbi:translation initiation factor IF-6 [Acidianus sulfidivorans JP7]|uniref:Translation initiation factor 6 n=1 Tax=Acidianus sulfidivorans JP7 TaxID=619593 RepID=A0A2U9INY5_9CREN|nr:translation initiation factor IF-6 [Acidianus sulfidivorans]AWR97711.1 translation initiation factor IF-6 [Acidianus sulfidivorans JP7]